MIERALGLLLLHALWEPIAIAAAAFVLLRIGRRWDAATRCGVLTAAICASLVLPIITTAVVVNTSPSNIPVQNVQMLQPAPPLHVPVHVTVPPARTQDEQTQTRAIQPAPAHRAVFVVPQRAVVAIVLAWAAIVLVLLVRLLISMAHLHRLRRDALPISPEIRAQLSRWSRISGGANVRLCLSDETAVPIAVGLFDSMVLIPRRLIEELEPADLDRIVLHEIAHLRRRDGLLYAVQQITRALYFFNPAIAWLTATLDIEREVACDDWVLERNSEAAPYASCLVRLAEGVPWPHKALAAPGAFVTRHSMSIRIERILQHARDARRLHAAPAPVAAALAVAGIIAVVGLSFAPSLAYTATATAPKPSAVAKSAVAKSVAKPSANVTVTKKIAIAPVKAAKPAVKPTTVVKSPLVLHDVIKTKTVKRNVVKTLHAPVAAVHSVPSLPTLVAAASANPTAMPTDDYIDQMRALFGSNLSIDDLVALKSTGVTPDYVRQMRSAGLGNLNAEQIIGARSVGLSAATASQFRAQFGTVSFDDLMAMQSLHVTPAYRDQLRAAGLTNLTARQLISLKSVGVTPAYVKQADSLGFGTLTSEQLITLASMHIDADYIKRVHEHGFNHITLDQLIELRSSGIIK